MVSDDEVWSTLQDEMAATKIQSNFRGYRARKQLQREDAMQVTTSGSSQATPSSGSVEAGGRGSAASEASPREERDKPARSSGEYHDIIALTPPSLQQQGEWELGSACGLDSDTLTSTAPLHGLVCDLVFPVLINFPTRAVAKIDLI